MAVYGVLFDAFVADVGKYPAAEKLSTYQASTTAGTFDSTYCNQSINVGGAVFDYAVPVLDLGSDVTELWLHFELYPVGFGTSRGWVRFLNSSGVEQFRMYYNGSNSVLQRTTNGTTFSNVDGSDSIAFAFNTRHRFDIHVKPHATAGIAEVYLNDSLTAIAATGDVTTQSNTIRYVLFESGGTNRSYLSQVIAADVSTVGWKLQTLHATSIGADNGWAGNTSAAQVSAISMDTTQTAYSNTVGARQSYVAEDITALASSMVVQAVCVAYYGQKGNGSTPSQLQPFVKISGTNYDGTNAITSQMDGIKAIQHIWQRDPSTSVVWAQAAVNGLEFGVVAS